MEDRYGRKGRILLASFSLFLVAGGCASGFSDGILGTPQNDGKLVERRQQTPAPIFSLV
jgi:hypothetical protein